MKRFFEVFFNVLFFPLFIVEYFLIYFYKKCISPLLPGACRFYPTCSIYFLQALKEYGFLKGNFLGFYRILRCNPRSEGGWDPLKPNIKGKIKWIL